jgi:curli biogenesis system outer membrane secretion channel CsgG
MQSNEISRPFFFQIGTLLPIGALLSASAWLATSLAPKTAMASEPPTVSILRFSQEVDHTLDDCRGWNWSTQDQLRTELERALSELGVTVLERRDIGLLHASEHDLINADPRKKPKAGLFKTARYSITGGITELGICENSEGSGISLGGIVGLLGGPAGTDIDVSTKKAVSTVKLVAQVVSVETGEILKSFEARSQLEDQGYAVGLEVAGIGGRRKTSQLQPIERATNQAIAELAKKIAEYLKTPSNSSP